MVNGRQIKFKLDKGYALVDNKWEQGDQIDVEFPMEIRRISSHPAIKANEGKIALRRGPLVYCVEWPDVPDSMVFNLVIDQNAEIKVQHEPGILNGITTLKFNAKSVRNGFNGEAGTSPKMVTAIPYYCWAHRGQGEMAVWLPMEK